MAVAEQTVAALAKQLKITVSRLLSLLKEAGIAVENEEGIFEINISEIKKAKTYLEW